MQWPGAWALTCALWVLAGPYTAAAAPLGLYDRNGSVVAVEPYDRNIVRITIATDRDQALAAPGFGFVASPNAAGWSANAEAGAGAGAAEAGAGAGAAGAAAVGAAGRAGGDGVHSPRLIVEVEPQPPPGVPTQMERYFVPSLPPVALSVKRPDGSVVLHMTGWEMAPHVVNGERTFQVGARFAAPPGEHYYGLGQNQEGVLDHRGRTVDCQHYYDAPAGETVCVPFMVTNRGYGVIWDNPSETVVSAGLDGQTVWRSKVGERVSFFVIVGASSDEIYAGYRKLTGITPLPPKAAFGYIQSKARYASQQQILDVAAGYRRRGYPLDVMVLDWFYWTRMGQIDFDPAAFPDPAAMNRTLHEEGVRSIISVWPRFERESRYFDELAAREFLLKDASGKPVDGLAFRSDRAGALLDSTNPAAREWFWDRIRDNIASRGFDWFWLDETEPDLVPDGYYYRIGSGDRYHNLYPLLHTEGVAEGSRRDRPDKRNLILARAAYLGSQRYGSLFWSSDINPSWDALQRQVPTGLDFTASGLAYWGNDIGGWQPLPAHHAPERAPLLDGADARAVIGDYPDYPELITRWYEYATFTPTLRAHGSRAETEVWSYGKQAEAIIARYLRLRYALMPYLYSLGKHTYDTGAPFMRALFMDFPDDSQAAAINDEYLFGPAFLVAPVTTQGVESREVYLPAGSDWYDYWTEEKFAGGRTVTVRAPIDVIPLFVRAGSIVPFGVAIPSTATPQPLAEIRVYAGADADFGWYDDDGVSNAYEHGAGETRRLRWSEHGHALGIDGAPAASRLPGVKVRIIEGRP